MAGAYTQLYFHAVTSVKFRKALIDPAWEAELFAMMGDALRDLGHDPIRINGTQDHVHLLWDHNRTQTIAQTMKIVKGRSSKWINAGGLTPEVFRWQAGYGAFSVSVDRVNRVDNYILHQKEHHRTVNLQQEYAQMLRIQGVQNPAELMFEPLR